MAGPWIAAFVVLACTVAVLVVLMLGLMRRALALIEHAQPLLAGVGSLPEPGGLKPEVSVPAFEITNGKTASFSSTDLASERSLLVFLAPECPPCHALAQELIQHGNPAQGVKLFVAVPDSAESRQFAANLPAEIVYQEGTALSDIFETRTTPHAFALESGIVRAVGVPNTRAQLLEISVATWGEVSLTHFSGNSGHLITAH